jgi:hypothetical protein
MFIVYNEKLCVINFPFEEGFVLEGDRIMKLQQKPKTSCNPERVSASRNNGTRSRNNPGSSQGLKVLGMVLKYYSSSFLVLGILLNTSAMAGPRQSRPAEDDGHAAVARAAPQLAAAAASTSGNASSGEASKPRLQDTLDPHVPVAFQRQVGQAVIDPSAPAASYPSVSDLVAGSSVKRVDTSPPFPAAAAAAAAAASVNLDGFEYGVGPVGSPHPAAAGPGTGGEAYTLAEGPWGSPHLAAAGPGTGGETYTLAAGPWGSSHSAAAAGPGEWGMGPGTSESRSFVGPGGAAYFADFPGTEDEASSHGAAASASTGIEAGGDTASN